MQHLTKTVSDGDGSLVPMTLDRHDNTFEMLYKNYWPPLLNFASQYIADKTTREEIVQELFIHIYVKGITLKNKDKLIAYLYVSLKNRILNHFRDEALYRKHLSNAARSSLRVEQNTVEKNIGIKELQKAIWVSVHCMPVKYRQVYELRNDHLTVKKIAEVLRRPADTVEKQLYKVNQVIREKLNAEKGDYFG